MKIRDSGLNQLFPIWERLKLRAKDGKIRETDCSNQQGILRIIQSIPSKKAEPFKLWLAKVGKERIEEIQNPELAMVRMKQLYQSKGYSPDWIEKRARGITIRNELTGEWQDRGVKNSLGFAIGQYGINFYNASRSNYYQNYSKEGFKRFSKVKNRCQ